MSLNLIKYLLFPNFRFPYLDNVALQAGYGFVEAMLEPHAKEAAGMTQAQVGWAFLIMGASYMVQAPIVGHVRKSQSPPKIARIVTFPHMLISQVCKKKVLRNILGRGKFPLHIKHICYMTNNIGPNKAS